jgi:hypothetical protein
MKVKDLIEELQELNPEATICISDSNGYKLDLVSIDESDNRKEVEIWVEENLE